MTLPLAADEGMWLFDNPPTRLLKQKYGFKPTNDWLTHLQQAAVRFNSGGSGSFVSADGLVMTNHHVGADALQKISSAEKDYLKDGFYAKRREDEIRCVDVELNVLQQISDVTERVNAAVKPDMSPTEAQKARRAVTSTIEKEALDKSGLRSDVVTLYQGGLYHLYQYKKYTDVRLVFAPEQEAAFFGGDPDNFEYPRYDLDICFFRVYEKDQPAKIEHYLTWSQAGAKEDELIFVAGHPGRTNRLDTVRHLEFLRDRSYPSILNNLRRREVLLRTYSERSLESARRAKDELFGYQNSRKARLGGLAGLQDPTIMNEKREAEAALKAAIRKSGKNLDALEAYDEITAALRLWEENYTGLMFYESHVAFNTELYNTAIQLVRMAEEDTKDNAERLREFRESNRDSLEQSLFSEAPIYQDLEIIKLADSLGHWVEVVGADDPLVKKVLAGKSPRARAAELITGSKLADVAVRKELAKGGRQAIEKSTDPMIVLARLIDGPAREVRKIHEEKIDEPMRQAYGKIAKARFAIGGADNYPDATFTLRLAYGTVKGYKEDGKPVPPWTTLGGTFKHAAEHGNREPYLLPKSWHDAKDKIASDTPYNFVSTADIIGGNSGSPVVNARAEVVGIIFDGNIHSLVLDFAYSQEQARAVSVHSAGIIEALKSIYGAAGLVEELTAKR